MDPSGAEHKYEVADGQSLLKIAQEKGLEIEGINLILNLFYSALTKKQEHVKGSVPVQLAMLLSHPRRNMVS